MLVVAKQRRRIDEARYVAVLGGQEAFKKSLAAALAAESIVRARRMARLRAVYRTTGAHRCHRAVRDALEAPAPHRHRLLPNAPRRIKHRFTLHRGSPLNRACAAASM